MSAGINIIIDLELEMIFFFFLGRGGGGGRDKMKVSAHLPHSFSLFCGKFVYSLSNSLKSLMAHLLKRRTDVPVLIGSNPDHVNIFFSRIVLYLPSLDEYSCVLSSDFHCSFCFFF